MPQDVSKNLDNPVDAYEWLLNACRGTSKERLLEMLRWHPEYARLQDQPQIELAKIYAEGMAWAMLARREAVAGD